MKQRIFIIAITGVIFCSCGIGPGGGGVAVSSYSSIYQFGFTGGLSFDFDKGRMKK